MSIKQILQNVDKILDEQDEKNELNDDAEFIRMLNDNGHLEESVEKTDEKTVEKTDEQISEKVSEESTEKTSAQTDEESDEKTDEKVSEESTEKTDEKTDEKVSEESTERSTVQTSESTEKVGEETEQSTVQTNELDDDLSSVFAKREEDKFKREDLSNNPNEKVTENEDKKTEFKYEKADKKEPTPAEIEKMKNAALLDISKQVKAAEKKEIVITLPNKQELDFLTGFLDPYVHFPLNLQSGKLRMNDWICSTTGFKFDCFDSPNLEMMHKVSEKIIALEKLNDIFSYKFIDTTNMHQTYNFHLNDLTETIGRFIVSKSKLPSLKIENSILYNMLTKLMVNLCTFEELAFRENSIKIGIAFKQVIAKDFRFLNSMQIPQLETIYSWEVLRNSLLNTTSSSKIFSFKSYQQLEQILRKVNTEKEFQLEALIGNTLKTYQPSIVLNYMYVIRSVYIIARLLSIYIYEKKYLKKNIEEIVRDFYYIGIASVSTYENLTAIYSQMLRSFPSLKNDETKLSKETTVYLNNHLVCGGQYYLLKKLERAILRIAFDLVNLN